MSKLLPWFTAPFRGKRLRCGLLLFGALASSCTKPTESMESTESPPAHPEHAAPGGPVACRQLIVNDSVCNNILDVQGIARRGLAQVLQGPITARYETNPNQYDERYVDTVYTLRAGTSELELKGLTLKNPARSVPIWLSANISDRSIRLYGGIAVGMHKAAFLHLLGATGNGCDTIQLDTEEQNAYNYFVFKHDTLATIQLMSTAE